MNIFGTAAKLILNQTKWTEQRPEDQCANRAKKRAKNKRAHKARQLQRRLGYQ